MNTGAERHLIGILDAFTCQRQVSLHDVEELSKSWCDCDRSTAEAVLQEMDNINIRRNRRSGEVERLRMWTDTEFVST